ncbi:glycine cleavage T C-terminal barrel domain-containing protein, partial [Steroidobacter sp.]|uniref:glycine cleavage T C-terminal barrel domain-containing protein n=1 Tax=Steroidobacter sp. TaxID=1978227 RepID=UPI001A4FE32A
VIADGVIMRHADDRFIATVSSDHADHLFAHFQYWRDRRWSDHRVVMTDVTEAWAAIAVAGPNSREKLSGLLGEPSINALAHMTFFETQHRGSTLRVLRASYSGELAYELHCQPDAALSLCQLLADSGLKPDGLEALDVLRTEKGYLGGSEMNGQTTPDDLGLSTHLQANNQCIGSALLNRAAFHAPERPALIGIRATDGRSRFLAGAQITSADQRTRSAGHVTSAVFSPALSQWVGLALIDRNVVRSGVPLLAMDPLRQLETAIVTTATTHFDPTGERMKSS